MPILTSVFWKTAIGAVLRPGFFVGALRSRFAQVAIECIVLLVTTSNSLLQGTG